METKILILNQFLFLALKNHTSSSNLSANVIKIIIETKKNLRRPLKSLSLQF